MGGWGVCGGGVRVGMRKIRIYIAAVPKHVHYYMAMQFCIVEDFVQISFAAPLLLTDVTVRTHLYTQMKF
jgi:hypothetical protein